MLLVDHRQAEILEPDVLLDQCVRAKDDLGRSLRNRRQRGLTLFAAAAAS